MHIITFHKCKITVYLAIGYHAHCMVVVQISHIISNLKLDTACEHPHTQLIMSRCKLTFSKRRLTCSHK